jgi:prefoldin alpha subunit
MTNEELIMQLQYLEQHASQLEQHIQQIDQHIIMIKQLQFGIDDINNSNGKEILAQLGRGMFVKAKLSDHKILSDVGGGNFVPLDSEKAKENLDKQANELQMLKEHLLKEMERLNGQMNDLLIEAQENKD